MWRARAGRGCGAKMERQLKRRVANAERKERGARAREHTQGRMRAGGRARMRKRRASVRARPTLLARALLHARTVPRARAEVFPPGTYSARRQRPTSSRTALCVLPRAFGIYTRKNQTNHEILERGGADGWLNQQPPQPQTKLEHTQTMGGSGNGGWGGDLGS